MSGRSGCYLRLTAGVLLTVMGWCVGIPATYTLLWGFVVATGSNLSHALPILMCGSLILFVSALLLWQASQTLKDAEQSWKRRKRKAKFVSVPGVDPALDYTIGDDGELVPLDEKAKRDSNRKMDVR
jgi:hypothetical protein